MSSALCLAMIAGCSRSSPSGQVVAIVNDTEITALEAQQEQEHTPPGANSDAASRRQAALKALIDRKLLVKLARDQKLDATPETLNEIHRSEEAVLATTATRWIAGSLPQVGDDAVDAFLRDHPELAHPILYAVDQIAFPQSHDPALIQRIGAAPSLDAIQDLLNAARIPGQRRFTTWTSISMPPELAKSMSASDGKEPLVFSGGSGMMIAGVRIAARNVTPSDEELKLVARRTLQQQRQAQRVSAWMDSARKSAKVTYNEAFAPSGAPAATPTD